MRSCQPWWRSLQVLPALGRKICEPAVLELALNEVALTSELNDDGKSIFLRDKSLLTRARTSRRLTVKSRPLGFLPL